MKVPPRISRARLQSYQKLTQKKYRRQEHQFIIEGGRMIDEALRSDWKIETLLVTDAFCAKLEFADIEQRARAKGIPMAGISERELTTLSDTVTAQGAVGIVHAKQWYGFTLLEALPRTACVVVLSDVTDPGNVGTIVRTCDWFGVNAVILGGATVELYNPKVQRSAMGSIFHLPVIVEPEVVSMLKKAKQSGWQIWTTTLTGGQPLKPDTFKVRTMVVFGNEAHGVPSEIQDIAEKIITIPRLGRAESLNVAVACGVVLGNLTT